MANPSEMRPLMFALLKACATWDDEGVAAIMAGLDGIADRDLMIFCLAAWVNERAAGSIELRLVYEAAEHGGPEYGSDGELRQAATAEWVTLLDGSWPSCAGSILAVASPVGRSQPAGPEGHTGAWAARRSLGQS